MNNSALFPPTSCKTYYPRTRPLTLVALGGLTLLFLALWVIRMPSEGVDFLLILFSIVAYLIAILPVFYRAWQSRVVTSPQGVEYYRPGYCLRTTWNNIEQIVQARSGSQTGIDVLMLHEPGEQIKTWRPWLGDNRFDWLEQNGQFILPNKAIPISLILPDWRQTGISLDIRQYAPHLEAEDHVKQ
jgi:hypothetical protein